MRSTRAKGFSCRSRDFDWYLRPDVSVCVRARLGIDASCSTRRSRGPIQVGTLDRESLRAAWERDTLAVRTGCARRVRLAREGGSARLSACGVPGRCAVEAWRACSQTAGLEGPCWEPFSPAGKGPRVDRPSVEAGLRAAAP